MQNRDVDDMYTLTADFFQQQYQSSPVILPQDWSLTLGGLIETAHIVTHADLSEMPSVTLDCTLACGHSSNHQFIGHASWQGIAWATLLDMVELLPEARFARMDMKEFFQPRRE